MAATAVINVREDNFIRSSQWLCLVAATLLGLRTHFAAALFAAARGVYGFGLW
jgi:hypothetical protein